MDSPKMEFVLCLEHAIWCTVLVDGYRTVVDLLDHGVGIANEVYHNRDVSPTS